MAQTYHSLATKRRESFEKLFLHYARGLMVYARQYVSTHEEAEDIVHDIFVSFWERMDGLSDDNIKAYLFRSTRNRCLDHISRDKVRSEYCNDFVRRMSELDLNPNFFIESELEKQIRDAIDQLPPQRRRIFIKSKFEGMSYADIGKELEISARTVEKHVEIARKTLREHLSDYLCVVLMI